MVIQYTGQVANNSTLDLHFPQISFAAMPPTAKLLTLWLLLLLFPCRNDA